MSPDELLHSPYNIQMEPTRQTVRAIMRLRRGGPFEPFGRRTTKGASWQISGF
jgi:hypothetical protein